MTQTDTAAAAAQHGSLSRGWPALALSLFVAIAAAYSFSHRPPPAFPATRVQAGGLLVNALARQDQRFVAVGEQGRILIADGAEGDWKEATVEPQRNSTLTGVAFVDKNVAIAVGHDSWILRSTDAGQTWKEVHFATENAEPLLGLAGPYDGKIYAHGAFGQFLVSADAGTTWEALTLTEEGAAAEAAPATPANDPTSADYDPFAAYTAGGGGGGGLAERHLNAMTRTADGMLWLVGERGLLARSNNGGETWKSIEDVYAGSFFGILELPANGGLLVYGMRGNAFVSRDGGNTWTRSTVPGPVSLFDGIVDEDGNVVLVGSGDVILKSTDRGASFTIVSQKDRRGIAAVLPLEQGGWLTGGEGGIKRQLPGVGDKPESGHK